LALIVRKDHKRAEDWSRRVVKKKQDRINIGLFRHGLMILNMHRPNAGFKEICTCID